MRYRFVSVQLVATGRLQTKTYKARLLLIGLCNRCRACSILVPSWTDFCCRLLLEWLLWPPYLVVVFARAWFCKTLTHIPYGAEHLAAVRPNLFFVLFLFFNLEWAWGLEQICSAHLIIPRSTSCLMFIYMVYKAVVVVQCFTRGAHKIVILSQAAVTVNSICICVCLCVCVPPQYYTYMYIY